MMYFLLQLILFWFSRLKVLLSAISIVFRKGDNFCFNAENSLIGDNCENWGHPIVQPAKFFDRTLARKLLNNS